MKEYKEYNVFLNARLALTQSPEWATDPRLYSVYQFLYRAQAHLGIRGIAYQKSPTEAVFGLIDSGFTPVEVREEIAL